MPGGKTNCFVDTNILAYAVGPEEPRSERWPPQGMTILILLQVDPRHQPF